MTELEKFSDANALIEAYKKSRQGSAWKESVQRYQMNLLKNVRETQKEIRNKTYKQMDFVEFELSERGTTRPIKSMHISDRVVQRTFCDNAIIPKLQRYLIYDNGASVKGKGIEHHRKRIKMHLHKFFMEDGTNEGYILLIDFRKFFDNIPHEQLLNEIRKKIEDKEVMEFLEDMIKTFEIDVSYMSDEEYRYCMNVVYNSLEYRKTVPQDKMAGEKFMKKSLGIGSQISQIGGVFYPTRIDNYCKIVKGCKYYARYMDDIYVMHKDKEFLKKLLKEITDIADQYGLFINQKKTQIVKVSHGFTFLKIKYNLTETGKVICRLSHDSITRERRRLKSYARKLQEGRMTYKDIENAYQSWRGNVSKFNNKKSINSMDKLYNQLFIHSFKGENEHGNWRNNRNTKYNHKNAIKSY